MLECEHQGDKSQRTTQLLCSHPVSFYISLGRFLGLCLEHCVGCHYEKNNLHPAQFHFLNLDVFYMLKDFQSSIVVLNLFGLVFK